MARSSVVETDRHVVLIHAHLYNGVSKRTFRGRIGVVASPDRYLRKENHKQIARPWLWPSLFFFFFIKDKKVLLKKAGSRFCRLINMLLFSCHVN